MLRGHPLILKMRSVSYRFLFGLPLHSEYNLDCFHCFQGPARCSLDLFTILVSAVIPLVLSILRHQLCPGIGASWEHRCIAHTFGRGCLPHTVTFHTYTCSVCLELMNVHTWLPVGLYAPCVQRAHSSCSLLQQSLGHSSSSMNTLWKMSVVIPHGIPLKSSSHSQSTEFLVYLANHWHGLPTRCRGPNKRKHKVSGHLCKIS